jgi:HPt (histidine-containing phosphotransfer) domain-containing protein
MNTENPFDVQQLVRRCMGRIELAERLLASYESRFPDDLFKIEACLAADDSAGLARLVHQMKGAAANVSAPHLYNILARMEQAVRDDQPETTGQCLEEVQEVWERYLQFKSGIEQR